MKKKPLTSGGKTDQVRLRPVTIRKKKKIRLYCPETGRFGRPDLTRELPDAAGKQYYEVKTRQYMHDENSRRGYTLEDVVESEAKYGSGVVVLRVERKEDSSTEPGHRWLCERGARGELIMTTVLARNWRY